MDEERLRAVLDTAVDGVILIDGVGKILMFNPACERLFGYDADEVLGGNVKILMPEPFHSEHDSYISNYQRTGERKIIGIGREVVGRRKDGSTFPMDLSVGEARHGGGSTFVGIIHDITERKQTEQALRHGAAQLRAVLETAVDGVILIDASGNVLMFNPACEGLFGYKAEEVLGRNVKMLMPPPFRDEHDGYLENYRTTKERKIIGIGREVVGQRKDGTTFPMELSVGEAQQEGAPVFVGIIHDVTVRKQTEEQLVQAQKMEVVGQLSGGIAHDFNNLLTVIIGNSEDLSKALRARPDLQRLSDAILACATNGAELTRRLLAFSRRQTLRPVTVDCNRLVSGMQQLLRRTLRENVEIHTLLDSQLAPAFADAAQLESAILNLALNAQDAMPEGGRLTLSTSDAALDGDYASQHPEVTPGQYVQLAVTDDGLGMSPEVRERVFEPFFTTKDVGKGSGLGLSMVYGFVKQSGGHVSIYSEPELGTTVRLYLPVSSTPTRADAEPIATEYSEPLAGGATIMVTEDDPFVRGYAVAALKGFGYSVIVAADGREALGLLHSGAKPDLLFTDVVMPGGVNGWELARQAQEILPGLDVLFTSGYALEALVEVGRLAPDTIILNKPYRKSELGARVASMLSGRQKEGLG